MSDKKTVLLLGASGLTGRLCLDFLIADVRVEKVRLLARRPLNVTNAKLEQLIFSQSFAEQADAFKVDVVICCLGTTLKKAGSKAAFRKVDFDLCLDAAKQAKQAGVNTFAIISAVNADSHGLSFYGRTKGELEDALIELALPHLILAKPSLLLGERADRRLLEGLGQQLSKPLVPLLRKLSPASTPMPASCLASALVNAALQTQTDAVRQLRYSELMQLAKESR